MKITLVAQTEPVILSLTKPSTLQNMKEFSGLNAGICYLPDTLEKLIDQPLEKHSSRADITLANTHHSVFEHEWIEVFIEGVPKIVAMVLNSLGLYNTSEKSARYTVMKDTSPEEKLIYEKWIEILDTKIKTTYPQIDDKQVRKLALENARYMLSVFTPTTMGYTTTLRQFNYIIDWCKKFEAPSNNEFYTQLKSSLMELANKLEEFLFVGNLRDTKNREFALLDRDETEFEAITTHYSKSYVTKYKATWSHVAQSIRHKTLNHTIYFEGKSKEFYLPEIIEDDRELSAEWLVDIQSLAHLFPQGTLVKVCERGTLENFLLKCTERECGCAQLEIMQQTVNTHYQYENSPNLTRRDREYFDRYEKKVKCAMGIKCNSPCVWKAQKALSRKI